MRCSYGITLTQIPRFDPSRVDRHHRQYTRLEPSHRLAFLEFRRFGIVLPFGARNDHFNTPNRFLFSPEGTWLQNDWANPFESWEYVINWLYLITDMFAYRSSLLSQSSSCH